MKTCEKCDKSPFVCLADRRGFVLQKDVSDLERHSNTYGCPFEKTEGDVK